MCFRSSAEKTKEEGGLLLFYVRFYTFSAKGGGGSEKGQVDLQIQSAIQGLRDKAVSHRELGFTVEGDKLGP